MTRRQILLTPLLLLTQVNAPVKTLIVTTDIIGTPRPQGNAYDIGAYEYTGGKSLLSKPLGVRII